jgi:hypothetical protein
LTNRSLRALIAGLIPGYTARQIHRVPRSQRCQLTNEGRRLAVFFTRTYTRIVCPALAELDPKLPNHIAHTTALGRPWREFEHALDQRITDATITA